MNTKKKILFLVTQSEFGGAQRFIYTFVTALLRRYPQIEFASQNTQINAEESEFLYSDITYKIRGACFKIWKEFRGAYKEKIIERALAKELQSQGFKIDVQKQISVMYENENMGKYVPDMIVDDKVLVELKSKTFITKEDEKQFWLYLRGSNYKLGLLINFGNKLEIKRKVYDTARDKSAFISVSPKADNQRVSANYEVVVGAGPKGDNENGLLFALEKNGINTRHLKYLRRSINPLFDILGVFEIRKLIKKEKPDVLFVNSTKAGILGSLAAHFSRRYPQIKFASQNTQTNADNQRESAYSEGQDQRVSARLPKVIYRIGGWTFNDPWPNWKKKMYILIEKYTAGFKDYIVNNAESDRQQAIKLGIKPRKEIITIHNGMEIDKLNFLPKEEARNFLNLKTFDFVVGTIANDYPAKGLKYLIKAKEELRGVKTIILSKVPDAKKYLKAFDVFVLPSVKEGFPWAVLEAMAAGVPIIATKVGALPEIIQNNENGILIEPKNPGAIINAVKLLIDNKDLMERISEQGRKTVEEKFNLDRMIGEYMNIFNNDADLQI